MQLQVFFFVFLLNRFSTPVSNKSDGFGIFCHLRKIGGKKNNKNYQFISHFMSYKILNKITKLQTNGQTNNIRAYKWKRKNFDGKTDILSNKQNEMKCQQTTWLFPQNMQKNKTKKKKKTFIVSSSGNPKWQKFLKQVAVLVRMLRIL